MAPSNLFMVDTTTGRERQVTHFSRPPEGVGQHVWLPDDRHLAISYAAYSRAQVKNDLAILDIEDSSIARVTATIAEGYSAPSVSSDGSRLIATAESRLREVWKVPAKGIDPDANGRGAVRLIESAFDPLWTFVTRDGQTLLFNSPASGIRNLWIMALDGASKPRQITSEGHDAITHSALSPDGKRVTFSSIATGMSHIWTQNMDGSDLHQLTNDPGADSWPAWSPDGQWIVFNSDRQGSLETRIVPAEGGPSQKLIDGFFRGDWIRKPAGDGTWIVATDIGGNSVRLIDVERRSVAWEKRDPGAGFGLPMFTANGRSISLPFVADRFHDAIQILDVATGQARTAVRLPFHLLFRANWVDNDSAFIVNRSDLVSHIVLFDHFWERP
jgi:Tol biopolymer transport system component